MQALERVEHALAEHGCRESGGSWTCPAHEDRNPSLTVSRRHDDAGAVVHCHAGCSVGAIMAALGMQIRDLFDESGELSPKGSTHRSILATYDYLDEQGMLLYQVVRLAPKDFRQRAPDTSAGGGWSWSIRGVRRVLYRLPEVSEAVRAGAPVYVVEGEKDVHAVERAGAVATCNPGGAGKWRPEYAEALRGADVLVVRDADDAGERHAEGVEAALGGVARTVRRMCPAAGKDVADHLGGGYTLEQLIDLDARPRKTAYRSGAEVLDQAPEHTAWLWEGYIAAGGLTLLAGRHKGGKSTLLFGLVRALVERYTEFCGHPVQQTGVVILTEEAPATLRPKLEPISREGLCRLRVLCRDDVTPRLATWVESVHEAGLEAAEHGALVVVIDTFAFWSAISDENDAAVVQQAIAAVAELTRQGLGVVVVHHHRKSGGADGDAVRGSSALLGAVDVIVELARPAAEHEDDEPGPERELRAIGRYQQTPEAMRVRLDGDGVYRRISEGTQRDVRARSACERVREHLRAEYPDTPRTSDIRDATGLAKQTVLDALRYLVARDEIESFADREHRQSKRWRWVEPGAARVDLDPFGEAL